jgi:hypothetical protein
MIEMAAVFITLICAVDDCRLGHEIIVPIYLNQTTCEKAPVIPQAFVAQAYPGYAIERIECSKLL